MPDAVADWSHLKRTLTRDDFVRRFDHPFLLQHPKGTADDGELGREFATRVVELDEVPRAAPPGAPIGALVIAVVKAPGNPYPDRISIGRARNCDIVINDRSISKLHAHLADVAPDGATLRDANSSNGTRVNGHEVVPGDMERLVSGDLVSLGGVSLEFLSPHALYRLL